MTRSTINSRSIEGIHSIDATGTVTAAGLTVDTDTLHIDSTNNRVGIGRTSLNYKFEVSSASDVAVGLYNSSSVTSGNRATLTSLNSDASSVGYIRFGAVTDNVGTDIQFGVRPAGGSLTEAMRIDSSGRLIVGATYAAAAGSITLQSDGDIRGVLVSGAGGDTLISAISGVSNGYQISVDTSNNQTYKWHNGGAQSMTLDSSGNVGIGTPTTGSYRFNALRADGNLAFFTDGTTADLFIKTTAGVSTISPTTGVLALGTSSTERMRIDSSGNVGIGTSSPTGFSGYTSVDINNATSGAIIDLSQGDSMKGRLIATASTMAIETASSVPIIFQPAGTERMRIDSSGRVTKPYQPSWNTRSYGHNNASTGFTRVGSTDNGGAIAFTTQVGNGLNNGRFTAPVTGTYWVHVNGADGSGGNAALQIWKNGSNMLSSTAYLYSVNYNGTGLSAAIQLNANDYVEGRFLHFNSVNSALYDGSFSGFLIG